MSDSRELHRVQPVSPGHNVANTANNMKLMQDIVRIWVEGPASMYDEPSSSVRRLLQAVAQKDFYTIMLWAQTSSFCTVHNRRHIVVNPSGRGLIRLRHMHGEIFVDYPLLSCYGLLGEDHPHTIAA